VKQQNVHDHWSEQRQRERDEAIEEEQHARDQLNRKYEQQIFRDEHRTQELACDSAGRRRWNEVKKSIQTENRKDQGQKESTDVS